MALYEDLKRNRSSEVQRDYLWALLKVLQISGNTECSEIELRIYPVRSHYDWMTIDEVSSFIASSRTPYDHAIATVLSYTGARRTEAAEIRLQDIRQDNITLNGKGRKSRNVPVDEEFWTEMEDYLDYRTALRPSSDRLLLHRYRGKVVEYTGPKVTSVLDHWSKRFGRHVSPHTLRRSYGRHLYFNGCPLVQISKLMGHADSKQTEQYLCIGDYDLQDAIQRYRPSYSRKMYPKKDGQQ
jgi:integrase